MSMLHLAMPGFNSTSGGGDEDLNIIIRVRLREKSPKAIRIASDRSVASVAVGAFSGVVIAATAISITRSDGYQLLSTAGIASILVAALNAAAHASRLKNAELRVAIIASAARVRHKGRLIKILNLGPVHRMAARIRKQTALQTRVVL